MSVFSNPSSDSLQNARAYVTAILDLLGDRDPFEVLRTTGRGMRAAIQDVTSTEFDIPEADGKWSLRQILEHMADSELVWSWRLRLVLAEDRPTLPGYDQDRWAARLRYDRAPIAEALDLFDAARRANLRLLDQASADDFARVGVHAERGEESVAHMLQLYAGHDLLHLRQLARVRLAVAADRIG
jgi:uncharacterized damage-inducible protein DinB